MCWIGRAENGNLKILFGEGLEAFSFEANHRKAPCTPSLYDSELKRDFLVSLLLLKYPQYGDETDWTNFSEDPLEFAAEAHRLSQMSDPFLEICIAKEAIKS